MNKGADDDAGGGRLIAIHRLAPVMALFAGLGAVLSGIATSSWTLAGYDNRLANATQRIAELAENAKHANDRLDIYRDNIAKLNGWHEEHLAVEARLAADVAASLSRSETNHDVISALREQLSTEHERVLWLLNGRSPPESQRR